jgi:transposase-like protein
MSNEPTSLQEAIIYFADADNCLNYLVARRWPDGVVSCPTCGKINPRYIPERKVWQCSIKHPKRQFSVKLGTIFEDSPLGLDKWLPAVWLLSNCKNGISSFEIARDLDVTQKTAWFMLGRIRLGLQAKDGGKLSGDVEADESFIGGAARNMHKDVRARKITGRGPEGKAIVAAVLERGGRVRAKVIPTRKKKDVQALVREHVEAESNVYTDALKSYEGLSEFTHQVIDHAEAYVDGQIHTNGCENFWSLLKRGIGGTYISVEPFHLFRYVDEQAFRYNNRKDSLGEPMTDAQRFDIAVRQAIGKRLTWKELTGKETSTQAESAF